MEQNEYNAFIVAVVRMPLVLATVTPINVITVLAGQVITFCDNITPLLIYLLKPIYFSLSKSY